MYTTYALVWIVVHQNTAQIVAAFTHRSDADTFLDRCLPSLVYGNYIVLRASGSEIAVKIPSAED